MKLTLGQGFRYFGCSNECEADIWHHPLPEFFRESDGRYSGISTFCCPSYDSNDVFLFESSFTLHETSNYSYISFKILLLENRSVLMEERVKDTLNQQQELELPPFGLMTLMIMIHFLAEHSLPTER